jgi:hypothetical protein
MRNLRNEKMATLNLPVEDSLLQSAASLAIKKGTTLNILLNNYLKQYVDSETSCQQATQRILQLAKQSNAMSEKDGWIRDSLYER